MRIIVVGGGIVGLCCAIRLADAGHGVTVLEPAADRRASSWNNAGHIAIEQVAPLASSATLRAIPRRRFAAGGALDLPWSQWREWLPFGIRLLSASRPSRFQHGSEVLRTLLGRAMPAWRQAAGRLGRPDLIRDDGHLVVWETPATAAAGRRAWGAADIGTARLTDADGEAIRLLASLTGGKVPVAGAVRFGGSGQVTDLDQLGDALEATLVARGGAIVRVAASLRMYGDEARIAGHDADLIVVAAGVASGALLRTIGHRLPIIAERGYHIRAAATDWPEATPPIVFEDRAMIVTRYADSVQAASFVEFAASAAPPDPRKWVRLERHVRELGLPMRAPFTRWIGARPTLPDYLPAIGRSRRARNVIYAFGHQHLGLTLAPITAELVGALVDGKEPAIDLVPLDLARFGGRA